MGAFIFMFPRFISCWQKLNTLPDCLDTQITLHNKTCQFFGLFNPKPGKVSGMKPTVLSDVELKNIRNLIIRHPLLHNGKKIKNSIHKMQLKPTIFLERLNSRPSFAPWMHAQVCAVVIITYNTSWMVLGKKSHTTKASPHSWQLNASRF